jgi:aldose 1-epimerase
LKQISIKNDFLSLKVLDYGAIIQELIMYDDNCPPAGLVVGMSNPQQYLGDRNCMGACVGRFAGRISGKFSLNGEDYPLHTVVKDVHLHGGLEGFNRKYWNFDEVWPGPEPYVTLSYVSPHMEEGYPGRLRAEVTYRIKERSLQITHRATTDRKTVVNLVNHSYFLLGSSTNIQDYRLQLNCPEYLETMKNLLPTGNILPVKGSPYDFTEGREIGTTHLDTPFVINTSATETASLFAPSSGIRMRVRTNQPGIVVYTPREFAGICFETQNLPDAPNFPHFPSSVLEPGRVYENTSEFLFDYPGRN